MTRNTLSKESIRIALFELLKKQYFSDITVSKLCEKAGVGRRTFYRHYRNLREVMDESFWMIVEDFNEENKWPMQKEKIYDYFFKWYRYKDYFLILHKNGLPNYLTEKFADSIRKSSPEIDSYSYNFYAYAIYSILYSWFMENPEEDYRKVADTALKILK